MRRVGEQYILQCLVFNNKLFSGGFIKLARLGVSGGGAYRGTTGNDTWAQVSSD